MWWMLLLLLLCRRLCLLGFLVVLASAHRRCSTARPSRDDLEQTQREITRHRRRLTTTTATSLSLCSQCIGIDTYFHVFQRRSSPPLIDPVDRSPAVVDAAILETQLHLLNNAFRETPFFFRLRNTTLVVNDGLHDRFDETSDALRSAAQTYRMGDYSTLNVYFGNRLGQTSFAYLPENVGDDDAFRIEDGVWMDMSTLPTSEEEEGGGGGLTLVHEVGHWLGLLHTYEGNSCDPSNPNDYVADTPQQAFASTGCPSNPAPDTCPFLPGNDPVHNYMDLSGDECYREFTPLRIERMYILWSLYRTQQDVCHDTTRIHVVIEIRFDGFARDINWELTDGGSLLINQETEGYQTRYTMALNNDRVQHDICLPRSSSNDASVLYNFTILDDFGDGLEPPGFYKLTVDGIVLAEGADFGSAESTVFNATRSSFSPPPDDSTSFSTVQPSSSSSSAPSTTPSESPEHLVRTPSVQPSHLRVPSRSPSESPEHLVRTPSAQPSYLRVPSRSPSESPEQTTPSALPTNGVLFQDLAPSNFPTTLTISPSFVPSEGVSPSSAPSSGQLPSVAPSDSTSLPPSLANLDPRSAHPSNTVAPTVLPPTFSPSRIATVPLFPIPSASLMPSPMGNTAQPTDSGLCLPAGTVCSHDTECCSQQCLPALGARYCFARRNPPKSIYRVGRIENRG